MDGNGFSFEREWPETAQRLTLALRKRRIPHVLIDDLVQETGLRLYERWDAVDPERGPWPLAFTVAMNILKDHLRSELRRRTLTPPTTSIEQDPEIVALARIELGRVRVALDHLSEAQRSALLAEVGESKDEERSSSAIKMLRMRARKRLKDLTEDASAAITALELATQRTLDRAGSAPIAAGTAALAPLTVGILSLGVLGGSPTAQAAATEDLRSSRAAGVVAAVLDGLDLGRATDAARGLRAGAEVAGSLASSPPDARDDNEERRSSTRRRSTKHGPGTIPGLPPVPTDDEPPVWIEDQDASADANGGRARLGVGALIAGRRAVAELRASTHEGEPERGRRELNPRFKGRAQLDDDVTIELGD